MNASTIATAIAALRLARKQSPHRIMGKNGPEQDANDLAVIDAAIADLEALQADSAAAPQPVSEWVPIGTLRVDMPNDMVFFANEQIVSLERNEHTMTAFWPDGYRLCKRVAAPQPVTMPDDVAGYIDELVNYFLRMHAALSKQRGTPVDEESISDANRVRAWLDELQRISQPPYLYETGLTSVAMPRADRIASLEIIMSGLDDYWAIQPEVQGHIANVREWLDELQRRPEKEGSE